MSDAYRQAPPSVESLQAALVALNRQGDKLWARIIELESRVRDQENFQRERRAVSRQRWITAGLIAAGAAISLGASYTVSLLRAKPAATHVVTVAPGPIGCVLKNEPVWSCAGDVGRAP